MKKYKYAAKINFSFILGMTFFYGVTFCIYLIAKEDIDYIALKGGKIHVSPEISTLFYGSFAFFMAIALCWTILKSIKNYMKQGFLKVNGAGILIPKNINSEKAIMINYSEVSSINTTDEKVTINYNQNKVDVFKCYFDDEYKFRNFSTVVYSNFHATKKSV